METLLLQFAIFSMAVFAFSLFVRRTCEALIPTIRKDTPLTMSQRIWEMVLLPTIPVIVGVLLAIFVKSWPWPTGLNTLGARAIFGSVSGFVSTWVYRIVKALVGERFKVNVDAPMTLPEPLPVKAEEKPPVS